MYCYHAARPVAVCGAAAWRNGRDISNENGICRTQVAGTPREVQIRVVGSCHAGMTPIVEFGLPTHVSYRIPGCGSLMGRSYLRVFPRHLNRKLSLVESVRGGCELRSRLSGSVESARMHGACRTLLDGLHAGQVDPHKRMKPNLNESWYLVACCSLSS